MMRAASAAFLAALGVWVGGMATLGFVVAPILFRSLPSRLEAGTIFGRILGVFGLLEIGLALVCLVALVVLRMAGALGSRGAAVRITAVAIMLALVLVSQFYLSPQIVAERERIAGFDALPSGTPQKARFDRLHRLSVQVAGATLILGLVVLGGSAGALGPADGS
ncbi:MAG TPA: DUF4149 domain-containing protein [Planctomycetota bacterium]|nr:DUF4149 domain-containing protein [Planctomycetota bacterium]